MNPVAYARAVRDDSALQTFFKLLWKDVRLQRLFFCHKNLLFQHVGESPAIMFPWLYYDNNACTRDEERAHLSEAVNTATELRQAKTQSQLRLPLEGALDDAKAVASLLALRFVRANPTLDALLDQEEVRFYDVRSALTKQGLNLDVFPELESLGDGWEGEHGAPSRGDDGLSKVLRRHAWAFRKWIRSGIHTIPDMIDFGALKAPLYFQGRVHTDRLLEAIDQSQDDYSAALRNLWELQVIHSNGAALVCPQCSPLFLTLTNSALAPQQLRGTCPRCSRDLLAATAFTPHSKILEGVMAKDGMLAAAVAWLLIDHQIEPRCSEFVGDYETDFRFQSRGRQYLLECKMYRGEGPEHTIVENFSSAIAQAGKHADAIRGDGDLHGVFVVTNLPLSRCAAQLEIAKRRRKRSDVDIVDYEQLPRAVKELGKPPS